MQNLHQIKINYCAKFFSEYSHLGMKVTSTFDSKLSSINLIIWSSKFVNFQNKLLTLYSGLHRQTLFYNYNITMFTA